MEPGNNGNAIQQAAEEGKGEVILSLLVSYNGEPFAGFARQPGQLTVQGSIEEALGLVFRRPIETVCAGRTDSGVHARGQVVSFALSEEELAGRSEFKLLRSLNALTHEDISIKSVRRQKTGFSARFSCTMREYKYFICTDAYKPLLMKGFCWHIPKELDLEAMRAAAAYLIGEHDFKSFCAVNAQVKTTVRTIYACSVTKADDIITIRVTGNGFLYNMVRIIAGTLIQVGGGQIEPEQIEQILAARDREAAGPTAPAHGLTMMGIEYMEEKDIDTQGVV